MIDLLRECRDTMLALAVGQPVRDLDEQITRLDAALAEQNAAPQPSTAKESAGAAPGQDADKVNGLQIERVWVDEAVGEAPGLPEEPKVLEVWRSEHKDKTLSYVCAAVLEYTDTLRTLYLRAVKERDEARARVVELEQFNVDLASESERLREGLRFYAHGMHIAGFETWEGPSGDENWLCPPSKDMGLPSMREDYDEFIKTLDNHMIEDGGIAQVFLSGKRVDWEGEPPKEHSCEPAMKEIAATIAAARRVR